MAGAYARMRVRVRKQGVVAVQIVVDSTADIPPDRARELGIEVVPLTVSESTTSIGVCVSAVTISAPWRAAEYVPLSFPLICMLRMPVAPFAINRR